MMVDEIEQMGKLAWEQELNHRLEGLFNSHVFLRFPEMTITDLSQLTEKMHLNERELDMVFSQLRQATQDYELVCRRGWNPYTYIGHYPKRFQIPNGEKGKEKRLCLIQIFI